MMNKKETAEILNIIKKAYPLFHYGATIEEGRDIVTLWHNLFKNDDVWSVLTAIKFYIATDTKGTPPTIGLIKTKMWEVQQLKNIMKKGKADSD